MVAVGYDDNKKIGKTKGAPLSGIPGNDLDTAGYGWLPYAYIEASLAVSYTGFANPVQLRIEKVIYLFYILLHRFVD